MIGENMMKALLIHVAADQSDLSTLGVNAPIFNDGTFEFIPIPEFSTEGTYMVSRGKQCVVMCGGEKQEEKVWTAEKRTYSTIEVRNKSHGKTLSDYVPQECDYVIVHFDPDFDNCTYGDRLDTPRGSQISNLEHGDYIFFVASLAPYIKEAYALRSINKIRSYQRYQMAKFIIGYFRVQKVYNAFKAFDDPTPLLYIDGNDEPVNYRLDSETMTRIKHNAHTKRKEDNYYIVTGDPSDSTLLTRALQLTEKGFPFRPSRIGKEIFGDVSYPRGIKWIRNSRRVEVLLDYARACMHA